MSHNQYPATEDGKYRLTSKDLVDNGRYVVATEKLSDDELEAEREQVKAVAAATPGTPEWYAAHSKTVIDVDGNEHHYFDLGPQFEGMSTTEVAEHMHQNKMNSEAEEKRRVYWDELYDLAREGETEDPLAGQVDSVTANYEPPQHPMDVLMDRVHREHGN